MMKRITLFLLISTLSLGYAWAKNPLPQAIGLYNHSDEYPQQIRTSCSGVPDYIEVKNNGQAARIPTDCGILSITLPNDDHDSIDTSRYCVGQYAFYGFYDYQKLILQGCVIP